MDKKLAESLLAKHNGNKTAAAEEAGVSRTTLRKALSGIKVKSTPKSVTKTLSDFKAEYDKDYIIPNKIRTALKDLGSGWEYEVQFARMAGVSLNDLGNYRDLFSDYVVNIKNQKRAWGGTPAIAQKMRLIS